MFVHMALSIILQVNSSLRVGRIRVHGNPHRFDLVDPMFWEASILILLIQLVYFSDHDTSDRTLKNTSLQGTIEIIFHP